MAINRHHTTSAVIAGSLCAVLSGFAFLPTTLLAQPTGGITPAYTSRPTWSGGAIGGLSPRITPSRARGTTTIGTYLSRPHRLLRRNAFSARFQGLAPTTPIQNPLYKPLQADVDQTLQNITNAAAQDAPGYADLMLGHIAMRRRQALADGWAHFHAADYVRALAAFESAAMVAPNDPAASFGQFMSVAADRQHRRAMHKLTRLARLDETRAPGAAGMFEFDFSLADAFVSADALQPVLDELRAFTQVNPDNPPVQALHCFLLWYAGSHDARLEARSIAARILRTHPASPWARFHDMIQSADTHDAAESKPS